MRNTSRVAFAMSHRLVQRLKMPSHRPVGTRAGCFRIAISFVANVDHTTAYASAELQLREGRRTRGMDNSTGDDIGEDAGRQVRGKHRAARQQARCGVVISYGKVKIKRTKESSRHVEKSRQGQGKCKAGKVGPILGTARRPMIFRSDKLSSSLV